jgi:xanthine dehydrogenase small subunit
MRDYLLFHVNGQEHRVTGEHVFLPLSSYLRHRLCATGTKIVCEEGDCGACSVLVGRITGDDIVYRTVNSCIQYLFQVDGLHIITIEGLKQNGELNPVQESMVKCHGTQCGFCTPGFVVTMCEMFDRQKPVTPQCIKDALTGNLCRCTGYLPIIESGLDVSVEKLWSLRKLYPPESILQDLRAASNEDADISWMDRRVYIPRTLSQAVNFRRENQASVMVSGGTDICVLANKRDYQPQIMMSLSGLEELNEIKLQDGKLFVGGTATLAKLEEFAQENIQELHHILWLFGSPQIRNAGTLAGNIANASPIADTPPFLLIMNAQLELTGTDGTRLVKLTEFYKGYKKFDMRPDELISRIIIPLPAREEIIKLYKVSKRKHLDISAFTAAFRLRLQADTITEAAVSYGGVAAVVLRMPCTEEFLIGKPFSIETFHRAAEVVVEEITPISDVRGSKEFRNQLARNILLKFHEAQQSRRVPACQQ